MLAKLLGPLTPHSFFWTGTKATIVNIHATSRHADVGTGSPNRRVPCLHTFLVSRIACRNALGSCLHLCCGGGRGRGCLAAAKHQNRAQRRYCDNAYDGPRLCHLNHLPDRRRCIGLTPVPSRPKSKDRVTHTFARFELGFFCSQISRSFL